MVVAPNTPGFLAGLFVESRNIRALSHVQVASDDDEILVKNGRRTGPHAKLWDAAQVALPQQLAAEVVTIESLGSEEAIHIFAVRYGSRRRVSVPAVTIVKHRAFVGCPFPQHFA